MKTLFLTTLAILLSTVIFAQTPQAFKYQAVIRNNQGKVLVSQIVSLRVSILQNDPLGSPVYIETHHIATNEYGIANLSIGSGTVVTGIFADIAWGTTTHFVKTELDITGNQNYEFIGTSQLLSVPYALYAEKAGNANDDMDKDSLNEIQQLSLNANELSISKGNTIMLPPDNDHDTLNEIQALSLDGNQLTISKGNTITFTGAVDLDADPTNELQIISISNDTIYLTNGGFLKLPKEIDADTTNELQALNYSNDTLYLSKGNFVVLPHNFDNDSINELQELSLLNDTLFLSKANNIVLENHSLFSYKEMSCENCNDTVVNQLDVKANKIVTITGSGYSSGDGNNLTLYFLNENDSAVNLVLNYFEKDLGNLNVNYSLFNTYSNINIQSIQGGFKRHFIGYYMPNTNMTLKIKMVNDGTISNVTTNTVIFQ